MLPVSDLFPPVVPKGGGSNCVMRESSQGRLVGLFLIIEEPELDVCGCRVDSKRGKWFCTKGPSCGSDLHRKKMDNIKAKNFDVCLEGEAKASLDNSILMEMLGDEVDEWLQEKKHSVE